MATADKDALMLEVDVMVVDYLAYNATDMVFQAAWQDVSKDAAFNRALSLFQSTLENFKNRHIATGRWKPDAALRMRVLLLRLTLLLTQRRGLRTSLTTLEGMNRLRLLKGERLKRLKGEVLRESTEGLPIRNLEQVVGYWRQLTPGSDKPGSQMDIRPDGSSPPTRLW